MGRNSNFGGGEKGRSQGAAGLGLVGGGKWSKAAGVFRRPCGVWTHEGFQAPRVGRSVALDLSFKARFDAVANTLTSIVGFDAGLDKREGQGSEYAVGTTLPHHSSTFNPSSACQSSQADA